jgi:hypothetical protein
MKTPRIASLSLAVLLAIASLPAESGTVAGFGGSTEITQLANNVQLGLSYIEQVDIALNSARQYKLMLDQLKKNPAGFSRSMLGGTLEEHLANTEATIEIIDQLTSLRESTKGVMDEMQRALFAIQDLEGQGIVVTPSEYYDAMVSFANERGGEYERRIMNYRRNAEQARKDVEAVNKIVNGSEKITTQIQGLETIASSNAVIASLLLRQIEMATAAHSDEANDRSMRAEAERLRWKMIQEQDRRWAEAMEKQFGYRKAGE